MPVCSEYTWVNTFWLKVNWVWSGWQNFKGTKKFENTGYISEVRACDTRRVCVFVFVCLGGRYKEYLFLIFYIRSDI